MFDESSCVLCGATCRGLLCTGCDAALPRIGAACTTCGLPSAEDPCGACGVAPPQWDRCVAPFLFAYPLDRIVHAFKYHGRIYWARPLALEIVRRTRVVAGALPLALVPVPVTQARLARRGFNQALELSRNVGRELDLPVLADRVLRLRAESSQVGLAAEARRKNVRNAFALDNSSDLPGHVAIIDDLVTTGSTVGAIASLLKDHGATCVDVWAVARTPPRGGTP